jgi:hypothetical protein
MDQKTVETLAANVSTRIKLAKDDLLAQMAASGLTLENGWRIVEDLRHTVTGTEWTFRPVHLRETSPDMQTMVAIDHDGRPL